MAIEISLNAKAGDIMVCPNGHEIAEALDDLYPGAPDGWQRIGKYRQSIFTGRMKFNCEVCGAEVWPPHPDGLYWRRKA